MMFSSKLRFLSLSLSVVLSPFATLSYADDAKPAASEPAKISFDRQIRPIFQAQCQGCHQPAKAAGKYVMTAFDSLFKGGDSGSAAIVPQKPDESHLVKLITPANGKAEMPKGKPALNPAEVELIRTWIAQGAVDDSGLSGQKKYDKDHLPEYVRPPVITSLDYSPDGKLLAIAGFHEVLLVDSETQQLTGRLVGLSDRIESVRFSPDGTRLAATGGSPGRMGEIQIWDVATRTLTQSITATYDTIYGGSWSSDGKLIAFGGADQVVRAFDTTTGQQVLQNGSHSDWVLDTGFTPDNSHLISVSRDMTAKLTEVSTQRFVDNITSITPGALKGGIQTVASMPDRDEILMGGSDGIPKLYRVYRKTARVIGDDANLLRSLTAMRGRIFGLAISRDGMRFAASSALDGTGQVFIYRFDPAQIGDDIKAMLAKPFATRTPAEKDAVENYFKAAALAEAHTEIPANVYALAFRPDGQIVAATGSDGKVRLIDATTGQVTKEFSPAPIMPPSATAQKTAVAKASTEKPDPEALPSGAKAVGLEVVPSTIKLVSPFDYVQLLVTAKLDSGDRVDATRIAQAEVSGTGVIVSPSGVVRPTADGMTQLVVKLGDQSMTVPVEVTGVATEYHPDFIRDVNPILSRVGCNQGTCHGSVKGKNGFKLSLRGYDPIFDVRALTDDLSSRRTNTASPENSLALLKAISAVPHVGGQVLNQGEPYYEVVKSWVADGAKLELNTPRVLKIDVLPHNPVVQMIGAKQQLRVLATYADGLVRDVTREAFVESGNTEVASAERGGLLKSLRRGEAPMLVRYEGAYSATTLTVMGDRTGFAWAETPANNKIDELAAAKWKLMKIQPSSIAGDADFLRRVYLDLTGLPPRPDDIKAFLLDTRDSKTKRDDVIDRLVDSDDYVEYWSNKWADLLQVNGKFLAREGATAFRKWIRDEVAANVPYDQFAKKVITATGSNRDVPQAAYYKILREATATTENTMQLFLAIRFNCNKCHDHPFERWTQDQYYETAAYFAQFGLDKDPASGDKNIGGTAVESPKPLYEVVVDRPTGDVIHERTSKPASPKFPYALANLTPAAAPAAGAAPKPRREEFAEWLVAKENPYFAKSYVNRLWGYLFGIGIIEPIDDIRAGNPPTNPELLDYLTKEFLDSNFNVRHIMRLICKSRTYQLSVDTNSFNDDDKINYSHSLPRRLPAEVLYDTIHRVTGTVTKIPGVSPGSRAAAMPDSGIELPSGFFATFGRPVRESACECERTGGLQLGPVMALITGATLAEAISEPTNELTQLVASQPDDARLVNEIAIRVLNRPANDGERQAYSSVLRELDGDHQRVLAALKKRTEEAEAEAPILAKKREDGIARTMAEIAAYEAEIAPRIATQEKARQDNIAARQADIAAYDTRLPAKLGEWEKQQTASVDWIPLLPSSAVGSKDLTLSIESDRSVIVETKEAHNGDYTVMLPTNLKNITAIRLEVLPNDKLPNGGPGRASDGNFVLTEFELFASPAAKPAEIKKVELHKPLADYSQPGYEIAKAITGKPTDGGKGWGIAPSYGVTHWATFECKEAINLDGGTTLKVVLHHKFGQPNFLLSRFRISVAVDKTDVGLSLADEYRAIIATDAASRTAVQIASLTKHYRSVDPELVALQNVLNAANIPLPIDPKLVELRNKLELVSQPVPADIKLVQLQADAKASESQLTNRRLTASQDLVWALINSPAFLFNR